MTERKISASEERVLYAIRGEMVKKETSRAAVSYTAAMAQFLRSAAKRNW
jgi:hypothetical protein